MSIYEIWLIGLALAIDCLTVSIATGIATHRVLWRPMTTMALAFGLFQGGMLALGYLGTSALAQYIQAFDHWIAFGLLLFLGGRMIYGDFWGEKEGATSKLSLGNILLMAVATSIDALAVGVSMACSGDETGLLTPTCIVALCSSVLTVVGLVVGIEVGKHIQWHIEAIGGLVLITIGIKIVCEHIL